MSWKDMNENQWLNVITVLATSLGLVFGLVINNTNALLFFGFLLIATMLNGLSVSRESDNQ